MLHLRKLLHISLPKALINNRKSVNIRRFCFRPSWVLTCSFLYILQYFANCSSLNVSFKWQILKFTSNFWLCYVRFKRLILAIPSPAFERSIFIPELIIFNFELCTYEPKYCRLCLICQLWFWYAQIGGYFETENTFWTVFAAVTCLNV